MGFTIHSIIRSFVAGTTAAACMAGHQQRVCVVLIAGAGRQRAEGCNDIVHAYGTM